MLIPKKVKYRKSFKGRRRQEGVASRKTRIAFGTFGLKAMEHGWVSSRQIEAARRVMTRYIRKGGKVWIRVFPDKPVTKKGAEVPMGSGKGTVDHYVVIVKPGMVMFEMDGVDDKSAHEAMKFAGHKLSVKTRYIAKQ
ncbi:MAG: 50S ribosomal protein L16 [Patescibacteria group bacterium]|nr:50S ribosomal protein L16 [Patescibacteria group bacterium]